MAKLKRWKAKVPFYKFEASYEFRRQRFKDSFHHKYEALRWLKAEIEMLNKTGEQISWISIVELKESSEYWIIEEK